MQPRRHKTCDMSHIHHEVCAYLLCERPDALKINYPRVGGGARHDELRLYFPCLALKAVVINEAVGVNAVGHEFIELAAGIDGRAVGQVPAVGKAHAHHRVARLKYRRVRLHICLSARVGLHIRRLCAEKLLGALYRDILHNVHAFAAAVIPPAGVTLGVFIGQHAAHCRHDGGRDDILRSDKLQIPALPFKLRLHCFADLRVVFGDESYRIKIIGKHLCTSFSAG